jgi:hypothetical protein
MAHIKKFSDNDLENEIVTIMKENGIGKNTIRFTEVEKHDDIYGMSIWRNKVCVFRGGFDIDFDQLSPKEQQLTLDRVKSMKWKIDNALQ